MRVDKRWALLIVLVGLVAVFQAGDLGRFLTLASIKSSQADLESWRQAQPLFSSAAFFAVYVAGEWKRAHAPQALLAWVERFHSWRRG